MGAVQTLMPTAFAITITASAVVAWMGRSWNLAMRHHLAVGDATPINVQVVVLENIDVIQLAPDAIQIQPAISNNNNI